MNFIYVNIGNYNLRIELANSWLKRFRGLSGRVSLQDIDGMLFKFPWAMKWKMCMRGMKFPLDFVWIRKNKVVGVSENVSSGTVAPPQGVDSVLELAAYRAKELNISVGREIFLERNPSL